MRQERANLQGEANARWYDACNDEHFRTSMLMMIATGRVCCTCFDDEWQKKSWVRHSSESQLDSQLQCVFGRGPKPDNSSGVWHETAYEEMISRSIFDVRTLPDAVDMMDVRTVSSRNSSGSWVVVQRHTMNMKPWMANSSGGPRSHCIAAEQQALPNAVRRMFRGVVFCGCNKISL